MEARKVISRSRGFVAGISVVVGAIVALMPAHGQALGPIYSPGDLVVADSLNFRVVKVDPTSGAVTPLSSGGSFVLPTGLTFDRNGDILVVDRDAFDENGGVIRIDHVTGIQTVVSNNTISGAAGGKKAFGDPIALDRKGNNVYVVDYGRKPSDLIKVNLDTGKETVVSEGKNIGDPLGIDTSLSHALIADAGSKKSDLRLSGGIIDVNLKTGKQTVVATKGDLEDAEDIVVENKHSALVLDSGAFDLTGALFRMDLDNGKTKVIFKNDAYAGLAQLDKNTAYVTRAGFNSGGVNTVNLKTGARTPLTTSLNNPLGIEVAP